MWVFTFWINGIFYAWVLTWLGTRIIAWGQAMLKFGEVDKSLFWVIFCMSFVSISFMDKDGSVGTRGMVWT